MRKIILVLIVSLLVLPLVPRLVCAGSTTFTHESDRTVNVADSTDATPECFISLSRNVSFGYTCATDDQSYSIAAVHYSGDKEYGTASDTTLLFWQTATTGNDITATTNADSSAVNTWNAL